jgi:hypothetical protein
MKSEKVKYKVYFVTGASIDVTASCKEHAIILAQAEGINRCWNIDIDRVECI